MRRLALLSVTRALVFGLAAPAVAGNDTDRPREKLRLRCVARPGHVVDTPRPHRHAVRCRWSQSEHPEFAGYVLRRARRRPHPHR